MNNLKEKALEIYNNAFKYAYKIGFYNGNEYLIKNKHDVIKDFISEYNLDKFVLYSDEDIFILRKPRMKEFLFITNNDELTILMPNSNHGSCMSFKGIYFLMLLLEKIVFANTYFTIFTINKNSFDLKNDIALLKENKIHLFKKFYYSSTENKRINLIYIPNKASLLLELYLLSRFNKKRIKKFISYFTQYRKNTINYFIKMSSIYGVLDLIDNSANYKEKLGYSHKIKIGFLLSKNAISHLINKIGNISIDELLKNSKFEISLIEIFMKLNSKSYYDFLIKFTEIRENYKNKVNLILEISNFMKSQLNKCIICNKNDKNLNSIMCHFCAHLIKIEDLIENDFYFNYSDYEISDNLVL